MCGAAISAHRTADGELDRDRILGHVGKLVEEGVDAVAVSTAHGFSKAWEMPLHARSEFADLTSSLAMSPAPKASNSSLMRAPTPSKLAKAWLDLHHRIVAGVGIPQMTALYCASIAAKKRGATILADGGITKSGDMVKALTLADGVMCGSLLAGCNEALAESSKSTANFISNTGHGQQRAMKDGSAARYGHDRKDVATKAAAEGIEALKNPSDLSAVCSANSSAVSSPAWAT